jgi:hypothetical protein
MRPSAITITENVPNAAPLNAPQLNEQQIERNETAKMVSQFMVAGGFVLMAFMTLQIGLGNVILLGAATTATVVSLAAYFIAENINAEIGPEDSIIKSVAESFDLDPKRLDKTFIVHLLAEVGNTILLKMALWLGANPNNKNQDGENAIHVVLVNRSKNPAANIQALIDAGADINAPFKNNAPLELAIARGYDDVVEVLLKAGAKIPATYTSLDSEEMLNGLITSAVSELALDLTPVQKAAAAGRIVELLQKAIKSKASKDLETH